MQLQVLRPGLVHQTMILHTGRCMQFTTHHYCVRQRYANSWSDTSYYAKLSVI